MKILLKKSKFRENFILFGLKYQPEKSTCPNGGYYVDQILAIKLCHSWFLIIIKFMLKNIQVNLLVLMLDMEIE